MSQRLESNFYASASAVADDICLVWHNCQTFNEPGSDVYQSCNELSGFFDQQWKQAKLPAPTVRSPSLHHTKTIPTCTMYTSRAFVTSKASRPSCCCLQQAFHHHIILQHLSSALDTRTA